MSNDMRTVKFKMMIREIWEDLDKNPLTNCLGQLNGGWYTALLAIIYDYDKLNNYGKVIMEQVCELDKSEFYDEGFSHRVEFVEKCKDMEYRMKAAKELAMYLNKNEYTDKEKMHFIFWSLMILAVDDADKEEHLSLICDFAKMLRIKDSEMMGIVDVVRLIFNKKTSGLIESDGVKIYFKRLIIKNFKYAEKPISSAGEGLSRMFGIMEGLIK